MFLLNISRACVLHKQALSYTKLSSNYVVVTRQVRSLAGQRSGRSAKYSDEPVKNNKDMPESNSGVDDFTLEHIPKELRDRKVSDFDQKYQMLIGHEQHGHYIESPYGIVRFDPTPPTKNQQSTDSLENMKEPEDISNTKEETSTTIYDFGIFDSQLSSSCEGNQNNEALSVKEKLNSSKPRSQLYDQNTDTLVQSPTFKYQCEDYHEQIWKKLDKFENETVSNAIRNKQQSFVTADSNPIENIFDEQYFGFDDNRLPDEHDKSTVKVQNVVATEHVTGDHKPESTAKCETQENFFDDQYFGEHIQNSQSSTELRKSVDLQPRLKKDHVKETSELNFFDSQHFGNLESQNHEKELEIEQTVSSNKMFQETELKPQCSNSDDNYFDFQYFAEGDENQKEMLGKASFKEPFEKFPDRTQKSSITHKAKRINESYVDNEHLSTNSQVVVTSPIFQENSTGNHSQQKHQQVHQTKVQRKHQADHTEDMTELEDHKIKKRRNKFERVERKVRMDATDDDIVIMPQTKHHLKPMLEPVPNMDQPTTAYDVAMKIRSAEKDTKNAVPVKEPRKQKWSGKLDTRGFRVLKDQVMNLDYIPDSEMREIVKDSVLYEDEKIVAINKPYGLPSHGGPGIHHSVAKYMGELHLVHRLDKYTTGVMLLAKTLQSLDEIHGYFKRQEIGKIYWAITKNVPNPPAGVIDIPMAETTVQGKVRMGLRPEYNEDTKLLMHKARKVKKFTAITEYNVLDSRDSAALVECRTQTGIKHQIRCHLAFGMNCPILGDHKFSHFSKLAPQRLPGDMLERLKLRQPLVRYLALHLHARSVVLPEYRDGRNVFISARLPPHFVQNMKWLKLRPPKMDGRVLASKAGKIID